MIFFNTQLIVFTYLFIEILAMNGNIGIKVKFDPDFFLSLFRQ